MERTYKEIKRLRNRYKSILLKWLDFKIILTFEDQAKPEVKSKCDFLNRRLELINYYLNNYTL